MYSQKLSIVIPVYNSGELLIDLLSRINVVMHNNKTDFEIILVNDGSTNETWNVIEELKVKYPEVLKAVNFTRNYGQHNALLCGFMFCSGNLVLTMDDDLQHPPEEIPKLIQKQKETDADVVYGIYAERQHSLIRKIAGGIVRDSSDFKNQNKEGGSSFRLMKCEIAKKIIDKHQNHFLFLDSILNWYTGNMKSVTVNHHPRPRGNSGYTFAKLFGIYLDILYHYSTKPLKIIVIGGMSASIISFLIGLKFIYRKFVYDVPLGYTSIIVAIMFGTGITLFCLGIIGNYLYKLYQMQQNKPPFSIKKVL